jgi:transcription initiation factor TFIIIB Brf1 subunit/transcription initiation factor TFIIB
MSTYTKCPKCGKQNPTTDPHTEHTCIFCGTIIPPQTTTKQDTKNKDHTRKFPVNQSQHKPMNRNQNKPRFD